MAISSSSSRLQHSKPVDGPVGKRKDLIDRWVAEALREVSQAKGIAIASEQEQALTRRDITEMRRLFPPPPRFTASSTKPNNCINTRSQPTKHPCHVVEADEVAAESLMPSVCAKAESCRKGVKVDVMKPSFHRIKASYQGSNIFRSKRAETKSMDIVVCDISDVSGMTSSTTSTTSCTIIRGTPHYKRYKDMKRAEVVPEKATADIACNTKMSNVPPRWYDHVAATKRMLRKQNHSASSVSTAPTVATGQSSSTISWCKVDDEINESVVEIDVER